MTANTGRTPGKYIKVQIDDSAGTVRDIPVSSINGVGLTAEMVDLSALQDAIKGGLPGQPAMEIQISGPFDTTAAQAASGSGAAAALSGSHTVLEPVNNGTTPLTFGVYYGVKHVWETGEPAFGITSSATNGVLVRDYTVNSDGTYTATIYPAAGSATMDWGTAAYT